MNNKKEWTLGEIVVKDEASTDHIVNIHFSVAQCDVDNIL